ncbi:Cyclin-A2-1 [Bienertia sinuspersici]
MAQEYAKDQIVLKHGPYGSQCAENFCLVLEDNESVKEVIIRHGFIVDAIGFVIAKPCGNTVLRCLVVIAEMNPGLHSSAVNM